MERVFRKPKLLRALTSLDPQEFARLEAALAHLLAEKRREHTHDGRVRRRASGCGGAASKLPHRPRQALFRPLLLQALPAPRGHGRAFLDEPAAGVRVDQAAHPARQRGARARAASARLAARHLDTLLAHTPELRLLTLDGTERPIRRPKDPQSRKGDYSGKEKAHRKKNLLVASHGRRVAYLGPTAPGSVHDKKLADGSGLRFPADALVVKDTGFQGYAPPGAKPLQPSKKPRGRAFYPWQKAINQVISKVRVTVEHAIAGVKRCRLVADTFRNPRQGFVDEAMEVACGLHNLRVATRNAAA